MNAMGMPPAQQSLVERIRSALAPEHASREVAMFGGCAFMVNEKMVVSASKDGSLLVRVDAGQHDTILAEDGATQATMGASRRDMGPGWIHVSPSALAGDGLARWCDVALAYNRST